MKAPADEAVNSRQILVAQQFQGIVDALEEGGIVHLPLSYGSQFGAVAPQLAAQTGGTFQQRFVGPIEGPAQSLI